MHKMNCGKEDDWCGPQQELRHKVLVVICSHDCYVVAGASALPNETLLSNSISKLAEVLPSLYSTLPPTAPAGTSK